MEASTYCSETLATDQPSPSEPFHSRLSPFSPSTAASLSGPSSVSPMTLDSDFVGAFLEKAIDEKIVANPRLSDSASACFGSSSTSPPSSRSSIENEPFRPLAMITYGPNIFTDSEEQEQEQDPYRMSFNQKDASDDLYGRSKDPFKAFGSGYNSWTQYLSNPLSPPKKAFVPEIESTGVGAGLENLGNTCFMNAVLQCFTHTVPLVLGLRSLNHGKPCARSIESFCLLCALSDQIELSLKSSGGVLSPSNIVDNLSHISSCFQRYQQEDAHEFLQCLLDRLESCCSDSKSSPPGDCLVKKVFGGRLVSRLFCCNCGHISKTYEPLNDMSLEIEDVDTLPNALMSFTKVEKIEDPEARFRCENCKEDVSVEKQLMLDQAPSVATFHLKRFKTEGTCVEKIDKHVAFPLELDLQPYAIDDQRSDEKLKYQLYAVVKHSGYRPTSGHYVCYIRSSPDTWHKLNDWRVTKVEEEDVLSQEAYILFYARQDIPWFSTAIELEKPCPASVISDSSPKSVLDNIEVVCLSDSEVKRNADYGANEYKDVADRTSHFFPQTLHDVKDDEPCFTFEEILPDNASEPGVSKFRYSSDDDHAMTDVYIPPLSSSFDASERNTSSLSHLRESNCNQGIDGDMNDGCLAQMQCRSKCPDKFKMVSSDYLPLAQLKEKRCNSRKAAKRPAKDLERIEAMRYTKRMHASRGARYLAALATSKKRTGSSPCKRVSPRRRQNHGLMHPVPLSR